jgi:hypothetical protein
MTCFSHLTNEILIEVDQQFLGARVHGAELLIPLFKQNKPA